jgi:hypothetical protein
MTVKLSRILPTCTSYLELIGIHLLTFDGQLFSFSLYTRQHFLRSCIPSILTHIMTTSSWQDTANQKREAILAAIPSEWRIEKLPSVEEQVDVTEYIKQYLDKKELEITQSSADVIAKTVAKGKWTAEEVTRAFCHRAALAHQLVCKEHH